VTSPEDAWALQTLADDGRRTVHEGLYATDEERQAAVRRLSAIARTHVIANGVDLNYFAPQRVERHAAKLVFSGKMSYHANVAAALFLGREIMPLVWARRPDVEVAIVGSAPAREVQDLAADPRITVTGYVDDIRPAIAGATMAVAPLRYGVGIQNKVLEAMAMGMPVVAARQVARALQATDGHELVLAQEPAEYAARIVELLDSPARQAAIGAAGRRYVEQHHDWNRAADRLERIYAAAGAQLPPRLDDGLALDLDRMLARTQRQEHAGVMG
jgi:glycosyltransferase involved in cell wall biosynthesis